MLKFTSDKTYEALTAMAFYRLLWGFAYILLHPLWMYDTSIGQFDRRLVNQKTQMNDRVFRIFDSSKYLVTLVSNISPCQEATTLILIPLNNQSVHLWWPSKKYLGTAVVCLWCLLKSATVISFSQLHLSRNSGASFSFSFRSHLFCN